MILVRFQSKTCNITVIQVYAPTTDAEEVDQFYEDLEYIVELTPKKKKGCSSHHWGLECKSRKSGDTWSNRQVWLWSTKWSRAKANRVFSKEHTGHSKHPLPTPQQETTLHMDMTRWLIPKAVWLILCSLRWRSSIQSAKTKLGAHCDSHHQLLKANSGLI